MSSMSSTRLNKLVGILFYFFNLQNKKNAETVISYVWTSFGYSLLEKPELYSAFPSHKPKVYMSLATPYFVFSDLRANES